MDNIWVILKTKPDTAKAQFDYDGISASRRLDTDDIEPDTRQVARHLFRADTAGEPRLTIVDDHIYEGNEQMQVEVESSPVIPNRPGLLQFENADGAICNGCSKITRTVTITDEE